MVPTLKVPKGELINNGFIDGYVADLQRDIQYENAVYLLFQPKNVDKFRNFLDSEYERTKSIIEDYDYEDGYVVVVYKLDSKYKEDFDLVRKGKYSKTSRAFQKLFPDKIVTNKLGLKQEKYSLQYKIFNRTQDMIDFWENKFAVRFDKHMEVWTMFNEEKETLDINKIKEYV